MTDEELEALFVETGHRHHEAYSDGDGADPEWAQWYAAYLQAHLWDRLGRLLSRSELTNMLVVADREARASGDPSRWPTIYTSLVRELAAS